MGEDRQSAAKMTPDDQEREAGRRLVDDLFPRVEAFQSRWGSPDHTVSEGSSLAGDDRHSKPYQISHAVWLAMGHAIDNLHALRALTLTGGGTEWKVVTRPYGAYPLIRAAYENASLALWILGPDDRDVRITRRMRTLLSDARHRDDVARLSSLAQPGQYSHRLGAVRTIAEARGLVLEQCKKSVAYSTIVRDAAAVVGGEPDQAEAIWRTLSGLTHGDMWASITVPCRLPA